MEYHTRKKIIISDKNTCDELKHLYSPHQLEIKYGGTASNQETPMWPPKMPMFEIDEIV